MNCILRELYRVLFRFFLPAVPFILHQVAFGLRRREQLAVVWTRAARVSVDERLLAAWRNAVDAG